MGSRCSIRTEGSNGFPVSCRHAALPVAGRSASAALRRARSRAVCHWMRSATTCSNRWPLGMWSGSPGLTGSQLYRAGSVAGSPSALVIKRGACGAAGPAPAPSLWPWRPRSAHAGPHRKNPADQHGLVRARAGVRSRSSRPRWARTTIRPCTAERQHLRLRPWAATRSVTASACYSVRPA